MKKGFVYKIELENEIYVGSTEQKLCDRQKNHNQDLKKFPNRKLYKKCIEQGITQIKLIWVADIEFNHTEEKRMIVEEYRKELNGTLNSYRCYTTKEERKQDKKEHYKNHKEEVIEKSKEYYEKNKEHVLESRKKYYENNKEDLIEKSKEYNGKNKEKITEKKKEKIKCEICNIFIRKDGIKRHQRGKKCMECKKE